MKLLGLKTLGIRRMLGSGVACLAFWATGVAVLETAGRVAASDLQDALGLLLLGAYALATFAWDARRPLPWVELVRSATRRASARMWAAVPEFGVDFRQEPPIPRGHPRILVGSTTVLTVVCALAALASASLPSGARAALTQVSYTLYLALLGGLWALLGAGIFLMLFYPIGVIHDALLSSFAGHGPRPRRLERWSICVYVLVLAGAWLLLSPWVPLAGLGVLLAVNAAALQLPGNSTVTLLWQAPDSGGMRSLRAHQAIGSQVALLTLLIASLGLLACGEVLGEGLRSTSTTMPLTSMLGIVFLWTALGGVAVGTVQILRFVQRSRALGERTRELPALYVHGALAPAERAQLQLRLGTRGWHVRLAPDRPRPGDVQVRLGASLAERDPFELRESWPLALALADLDDDGTLRRLARRDELLKRRMLMRGLRRLFKLAARNPARAGNGYWLGLQHWFVLGMSRDADGDEVDWDNKPVLEQIVGPPYQRLFPPASRRYFRDVMKALEVDLVFVEDGVGFRRFRRTLLVLFETYDIHGGARRIEELHFVGLPGIRVVIHELGPGEPFRSKTYPEPDYEDIARARILHVFKDRGDDSARVEVPDTFTDLPVPLLTR